MRFFRGRTFQFPSRTEKSDLRTNLFFTYDQKCQSFSFFKPAWMLVIEHELNVSKRNTNSRQINLQEKSHLGDGWTIWFSKHEQQPLRVCDLKGFVWVLKVWGNVLYWTVAIWDSYPKADVGILAFSIYVMFGSFSSHFVNFLYIDFFRSHLC